MRSSSRPLPLGAWLSFALAAGGCGTTVLVGGSTGSGTGTTGTGTTGTGSGGAATTGTGSGDTGTTGPGTGGTGGQGGASSAGGSGQGGAGAGGGSGGAFTTGTPAPARIASGGNHTCVIVADTTVRCWGYNGSGQLGDGTTTNSAVPVIVKGLSGAQSLDAGYDHTCAVLADATVRCWGANGRFELADGTQLPSAVPVVAKGLTGVLAVALGTSYVNVGGGHGCAILAGGAVRCWGSDYSGELGDGTTNDSAAPVAPVGLGNAVALSSYGPAVSAALADGTLWQWGDGALPHPVDGGIVNAVSVSAGLIFACVLLSDGTPRCWGHNFEGQLGQGGVPGSHPPSQTPVVVAGVHHAVAIGSGQDHTCAVLDDGTLRCWGWNYNGQLGGGDTLINPPVVKVVGVHHAVGVAGGSGHTCALLKNGTVRCWGLNDIGQLGDGGGTDSLVAVEPIGL